MRPGTCVEWDQGPCVLEPRTLKRLFLSGKILVGRIGLCSEFRSCSPLCGGQMGRQHGDGIAGLVLGAHHFPDRGHELAGW